MGYEYIMSVLSIVLLVAVLVVGILNLTKNVRLQQKKGLMTAARNA